MALTVLPPHAPAMAGYLESRIALRPLALRDYRLLLAGSVLVGILGPFHLMTQVFWVNHEFPQRAVLYAGILAASRGSAMLVFSLVGGVIADRSERRKVLLWCESLSLAANAVIAALMVFLPWGESTVAAVAVMTFIASGIGSIDGPARSASIPAAAGAENVPAALALLSIANQMTMPISLPLVGILNDVTSAGAVYTGSLLAWAGILPLIAMLRFESRGGARSSRMVANIREGLSYARRSRPILAVLLTVVTLQGLGMPVATPLGPMFGMDVLGYSAAQVGMMGAAWGVGSLGASLTLARRRDLTLKGSSLAIFAAMFGVGILGFGYSRSLPLTVVSSFLMGVALTAAMLVAATLAQHLVEDSVRGRVLSLFPFSNGMAQILIAFAGALGERVGLAVLIPALGWAELALIAIIVLWFRELYGARVSSGRPASAAAPAD